MLEVRDLQVCYGNIWALRGVSLTVGTGEIVTVIGANGAGKSTLMKAVCGLLPKRAGEVLFDGRPITRLDPPAIARLGIAVVPEGRRLFGPLTVIDNLRLGAYLRLRNGQKREVQEDLERVLELFPRLRERLRQTVHTLSGGEQQMVAIGRSLMAAPKAILLDEPSIGLAPLIVRDIFHVIRGLKQTGITVLLIEQNARMALGVADRAYVLEVGRIILEDSAVDLLRQETVKGLYLATG